MTDTVETYRIVGNCCGRNFSRITGYSRNIIHEFLVFVDKDRAIVLIRENIIREILYLKHSRKFSPTKISRYEKLNREMNV